MSPIKPLSKPTILPTSNCNLQYSTSLQMNSLQNVKSTEEILIRKHLHSEVFLFYHNFYLFISTISILQTKYHKQEKKERAEEDQSIPLMHVYCNSDLHESTI